MKTLGDRLRYEREKRGWSQVYVAEKLGMKRSSTYANWEYNTRQPDNEMLVKLSELFDVSTDYLLCKTDDPTPPSKMDKLKKLGLKEDEEIHFLDLEGLTDEDIEFIKNQIEFLRKKAQQLRKDTE
ncbi:XRE family transcriptional regulator [Bacillus methanolicus]|uniref:helix-turn-helix domain-containing protein n=1 Tax=Bacillus methanolicus TaxID=1471 RepID=UPI00200F4F52|nr:helix-turn-helix transcriptional regulator [Bacillus methanolicus]UQD53335.1 XRE family transcriptional regulator [Bacillus methanolicus]